MAGLLSLTRALKSGLNERKAQCAILELDEADKPVGDEYLAFQYYPETIQDTKGVRYSQKEIPGGSLPLYQWVSGGERLISFTAVFSADVDMLADPKSVQKLKERGHLRRNVDIRTAVLWLRRFMMPSYGQASQLGVPIAQAPRKLVLQIQNSAIGMFGGDVQQDDDTTARLTTAIKQGLLNDSMIAIMTQCDLTTEAVFPSGLPRLATVQLQFAQVAQLGGYVSFPSRSARLDNLVKSGVDFGTQRYIPYPLKVNFNK